MTYHQRCGTYVTINKLITKRYKNNIKTDDDINASISAECIMIRDNTMTCDTMNQCDANDIVMYLTTIIADLSATPCFVLLVYFLTHHILLLYYYVRNKQYYY